MPRQHTSEFYFPLIEGKDGHSKKETTNEQTKKTRVRAYPLHRERLARARLPIREDAHVVSIQRALNELGDLLKHVCLGTCMVMP